MCLTAAAPAWAAQPPDGGAPSTTAGAVEPAGGGEPALDSATVAEIVKEVEIGAAMAEEEAASQPARKKAATAAHRPASTPARAASAPEAVESPTSLRGRSKAAWDWVKDTLPWLEKKDEGGAAREPVVYDPLGLAGSPFDNALGSRGVGGVGWSGNLGAAGPGGLNADSPSPGGSVDPSGERVLTLIRDTVRIVQEAVTHPMTWLVIALFVIGGFAMKKFDRRPK